MEQKAYCRGPKTSNRITIPKNCQQTETNQQFYTLKYGKKLSANYETIEERSSEILII